MEDKLTEIYVEKLSRMIQKETISELPQPDKTKFFEFHELLKELFPHLFSTAEVEVFDGSLLLKWKGKTDKQPICFMSHHDVVEAPGKWEHEPFSGYCDGEKLWGRGTLDTKGALFGILQAADELIEAGYVPERDTYFESACCEETNGAGCEKIAKELKKRGIEFFMTIDEGGMMVYDPIGGADATFAMIGVGEKGTADLKFIAKSNGGHASMPGKNTPLVRLGKFMAAVERSSIFESELSETSVELFSRVAPTMKEPLKTILSNVSKMKPLLEKVLPMVSPAVAAMLKTTIAFTMASGSDGRNVLPQEAWVVGNMRFSHHQGGKASIAAVTKLAKKYDIEVEVLDPGFESGITDFNGAPFKLVEETIRKLFPDVIPAPYIMTGASDSRYMDLVSKNCIRFAPFLITEEQLSSIHGLNENLDIRTLVPAVEFYKYLMQNN